MITSRVMPAPSSAPSRRVANSPDHPTGTTLPTPWDWRTDYPALAHTPVDVLAPVRGGVSALMRRLELRFGALDFVVTPDDRWLFLEINSNGQWAWIEDATGQPVAAAIADSLTRETS